MNTAIENADRDPVDVLAEQFVERYRQGERPALTEYTSKYPDLADEIRELFPALVLMEQVGSDGDATGWSGGSVTSDGKRLERVGDYRILQQVGRGGMGVVYEAKQESLGRRVALKVLPYHALMNPKMLGRFHREARAAAHLHHTNIVPVFGVGEADGVHYYAMQFIHGHGLDEVMLELIKLRRDQGGDSTPGGRASKTEALTATIARSLVTGAVPNEASDVASIDAKAPQVADNTDEVWPRASTSSVVLLGQEIGSTPSTSDHHYCQSVARIGEQVADALSYAHDQGILHRDVKPSNLLLDTNGKVWVTDFGLAKTDAADDLTHTGDLVGTLRYMAPERFRGWSDPRGDIYGLGLTMYELLALRPAYDETDRARLMKQIAETELTPLRKIDRHVPRDLETIIRKATAKEATHRYRTASELAEDLRRFLANKPIVARRTTLRERTALWYRRNPLVANLAAAVTLLLLAIAIGSSVAAFWLDAERDTALQNLSRAVTAEGDARQSATEAREAENNKRQALTEAKQNLYRAYLSQAQAVRWSGREGRRFDSLDALAKAAELAHTLQLGEDELLKLRNEAIACTGLVDLRLDKQWPGHKPGSAHIRVAFDADLKRYARLEPGGQIVVRRMEDNQELMRVPGLGGLDDNRPYILFSSDGRKLAVKGSIKGDKNAIEINVWDLVNGSAVLKERAGGKWHDMGMAFAP